MSLHVVVCVNTVWSLSSYPPPPPPLIFSKPACVIIIGMKLRVIMIAVKLHDITDLNGI